MDGMGNSSWILRAAFSLAACAYLAGCLTGNGSTSEPRYNGSDTAEINPNGSRRLKPPRVTYRTHDSVVFLDIAGQNRGYEYWYWIYRNGKLLDRPWYSGYDSGAEHYLLWDSLGEAGTYAYTVRYGYRVSELGPESPAFTYVYPGRSPSGTVSLFANPDQTVLVRLAPPLRAGASRARFERRTGPDGDIVPLDTVAVPNAGTFPYRDTGFVPYDTMVYYRASLQDAADESWLAPTAWDSVRIFNRSWNYSPDLRVENDGERIQSVIRNPPSVPSATRAFYFLYRSREKDRDGGTRCDSLPMSAVSLALRDTPPDTGTWYYWADARDAHGRVSPRSAPIAVFVSGKPRGPAIKSAVVYGNVIRIQGRPFENATAYILERSPDTARAGSAIGVDTLIGSAAQGDPFFVDVPPGDGFWFYRVIAVAGEEPETYPGPWAASEYFRKQDYYSYLDAPIRNLGSQGVQAALPSYASNLYLLYRSTRADGADSVAVDTVPPADTSRTLRDMPAKGTWYYRAYGYGKPSGSDYSIYRTAWVRIDFTGDRVGPGILELARLGTGIDVKFESDPEAVAYIVERSADSSGTWSVIDTLSVYPGASLTYSDHPPRNGNWSYRARTLTRELEETDPGPALGTPSPWIYRVAYENTLVSIILNRGDRVECPLSTSASYGYYLKRGPAADYSDPVTVDTAWIGDADAKLIDVPPAKVWYYWVERMVDPGANSGYILRSAPVRVEFTGVPEVISLTRVFYGIRVDYPKPDAGDTLEIWRGLGQARDTADFILVQRVAGPTSVGSWDDPAPKSGEAAFYQYRLVLRRAQGTTGFGPAKAFYYEPE